MQQVIHFIYGREMNEAEDSVAANETVKNAHDEVVPTAQLEEGNRKMLKAFYLPHTQRLLRDTLPAVQARGITVYGFDSEPWVS